MAHSFNKRLLSWTDGCSDDIIRIDFFDTGDRDGDEYDMGAASG
jgi:hypothetical protein